MKECVYCNTKNDNQAQTCMQCGGNEFNHLCAQCGRSFNSAFCPQCGIAAGDTGWKCPNCNAQVYGQFCQRCGHSFATQKQNVAQVTYVTIPEPKQSLAYGAPYTQQQRKSGKMSCPKCGKSDIALLSNNAKKASAAKIGLGVMTGGASLLLTGVRSKGHYEVSCNNCGHRWKTK